MELLDLLKIGGTPLLLVGIIVWLERVRSAVSALTKQVERIEGGMVWQNVCEKEHEEVNRRLENVERITGLNGRKVG